MKLVLSTSVFTKNDTVNDLVEIPVQDIIYFEFVKDYNMIVFHTHTDEYYAPGTIAYWLQGLKQSGFEFYSLDRNSAVQINKITYIDTFRLLGYFDDVVEHDSKKCRIAFSNMGFVKKCLSERVPDLYTAN